MKANTGAKWTTKNMIPEKTMTLTALKSIQVECKSRDKALKTPDFLFISLLFLGRAS
jgi:hypothetical protein